MATTPTPKPPTPAPPVIKPPKLNFATRSALNNAVEDAQDWLKANDKALRANAEALIDRAVRWVQSVVKPGVGKGIDWATAKINSLKF